MPHPKCGFKRQVLLYPTVWKLSFDLLRIGIIKHIICALRNLIVT